MSAIPGDGLSRKSGRPPRSILGHLDPGSNSRYTQGCRCDECREAHVKHNAEWRERVRADNRALREHLSRLRSTHDAEAKP